jgi:hypothetical protein
MLLDLSKQKLDVSILQGLIRLAEAVTCHKQFKLSKW